MNPTEIIKNLVARGFSLKGAVKYMAGNNPIFNNLIDMAERGDKQGVETVARNLSKEYGIDYDKGLEQTKRMFNIY